jgi:hypothetical protein
MGSSTKEPAPKKEAKKWSRRKTRRKEKTKNQPSLIADLGKRQLVDVTITEGSPDDLMGRRQKEKARC